MVISEITAGDHSKRADGRQRPRFRTASGVLAIAVAHDLALQSTWQFEIAGQRLARI